MPAKNNLKNPKTRLFILAASCYDYKQVDIIQALGVPKPTFYYWLKTNPSFANELNFLKDSVGWFVRVNKSSLNFTKPTLEKIQKEIENFYDS